MPLIACTCPNCGAALQFDDSRDTMFCQFCGTKLLRENITNITNNITVTDGYMLHDADWYYNTILELAKRRQGKKADEQLENFVRDYPLDERYDYLKDLVSLYCYNRHISHYYQRSDYNRAKSEELAGFALPDSPCIFLRENSYGMVTESYEDDRIRRYDEYIAKYEKLDKNVAQLLMEDRKLFMTTEEAEVFLKERIASKYPDATIRHTSESDNHDMEIIYGKPVPQKKSGCYVATCVYGSYDCPQVWTLRRYRDNVLAETWYGRTFIRIYYTISPIIVKWFGNTKWFKKLWRSKLDMMVKDLQSQGFESTPYKDRNWR